MKKDVTSRRYKQAFSKIDVHKFNCKIEGNHDEVDEICCSVLDKLCYS